MTEERIISLDTETTGLSHKDGDRVIEIGAVEIIGNLTTGRNFHCYANPGRRQVHPEALAVHGISNEFLTSHPPITASIPGFLDFIGDSKIVIHNAPFDMGFLNNEFTIQKLPLIGNEIVDSLQIARELYPMGRNTLDALCNRFGIDRSGRDYHGALIDAELLAQVYIKMLELDKLDLGDKLADRESKQDRSAKESRSSFSRPSRPPRPALTPTEQELEIHKTFISSEIKNSIWATL